MPIQRLVVVSDAHLGAVPQPAEDALLQFLDRVPSLGDALLINGDLFGFWFTYRRAIPRTGIRVVARLASMAPQLPILMTGGNHDRWGDPFWDRELGLTYGAQELRFELGGKTGLALHGDVVPGLSLGNRIHDALFQSQLASAVYRALPADLGFRITGRLGRISRSGRATEREVENARRQRAWAEERLRASPEVSLLVMGHSHRPAAEEILPGRRYLNPGAWFDGYRYAVATESALELRQFRG